MFSADLGVTPSAANYIEDVFSTYLYTGNGSTQTITNGIDLSGKGGLVWLKNRTDDFSYSAANYFVDSARSSFRSYLISNTTAKADPESAGSGVTSVSTTGFVLGTSNVSTNTSGVTYASWTFRKQAKFFDVVTYTGNGANRTIAHNLGSVPGSIFVKRTDTTGDWQVYHRSLANTEYMVLNSGNVKATGTTRWNSTTPTSTVFSLGTDATVNANGGTYVAYLFAHDAGGFGATGTDNVISCGSYTGNATDGQLVTLGYEPQWILVKRTDAVGDWMLVDVMRGAIANGNYPCANLYPNLSDAETLAGTFGPDPVGFRIGASTSTNANGSPYIYIAIRRGPMRTPTAGTSVFSPIASSAATGTTLTTSFPVDAQIFSLRTGTTNKNNTYDRLRRVSSTTTESGARLITSSTAAETAAGNETRLWNNTSFQMPSTFGGASTVFWNFRRAPGFFDVVCYTGVGGNTTLNHNLNAVPELMIVKIRSGSTGSWPVYVSSLGNNQYLLLNTSAASVTGAGTLWNNTSPTSSNFSVGSDGWVNTAGSTYVAYLFATVAGVSKVGSYTGTGTTKQIDCGFTGGARFVLIKRTDTTGDWYVWDSARGISSGNDPYLLLNSTAAEVTTTNYVDTTSVGFQVTAAAPAALNASGGSYLFLAVS